MWVPCVLTVEEQQAAQKNGESVQIFQKKLDYPKNNRYYADRQELCNALVKEYGSAQGCALYNHLKRIFQAPEPEPEKAVKVTRPRRGGRRKKPAVSDAEE